MLPFLCHHNYNAFRWKLPKLDSCNCAPHAWALGPEFSWSDFDKPINGWLFAICCPQSPTGILCLLLISSLICFFSFSLLCFYHCMTFSLPINIAIIMDLWPYPNLSWPPLNLIMLYNLIKSTDLTPRFWLKLIKLRSHSTSKTLFPYMNTSTHIQEFRNWTCPFRKQRFNPGCEDWIQNLSVLLGFSTFLFFLIQINMEAMYFRILLGSQDIPFLIPVTFLPT